MMIWLGEVGGWMGGWVGWAGGRKKGPYLDKEEEPRLKCAHAQGHHCKQRVNR